MHSTVFTEINSLLKEWSTTMKESTIDKLPKPTGWRILVLPYKRKEKTKGGIILTDQSLEELR